MDEEKDLDVPTAEPTPEELSEVEAPEETPAE